MHLIELCLSLFCWLNDDALTMSVGTSLYLITMVISWGCLLPWQLRFTGIKYAIPICNIAQIQ